VAGGDAPVSLGHHRNLKPKGFFSKTAPRDIGPLTVIMIHHPRFGIIPIPSFRVSGNSPSFRGAENK